MTSSRLTEQQIDLLLQRIHPKRVLSRDGNAYVEAHDIKAELNRVFGFANWDSEVVEQTLLFDVPCETKAGKPAFNVAYRSVVKLTVKALDGTPLATYSEGHVGDSTHPVRSEAHGNAVTNSESYALKRCAVMLGDQFGLSLYNKGSLASLVRWTLQQPPKEDAAPGESERDVPEVHAESLAPEPPVETRETSTPAAPAAEDPKPQIAADIRARALQPAPDGTSIHRYLTRLSTEAIRAGALQEQVEGHHGNTVTLKVFLEECLKKAQRPQGNPSDNAVAS